MLELFLYSCLFFVLIVVGLALTSIFVAYATQAKYVDFLYEEEEKKL
jgi:hypothetical protein